MNVGGIDRGLRAIVGVIVIGLGLKHQSWLGVLGLLPVMTAFFGWCPLYTPVKFSTVKGEKCKGGGCCCGGK